MATAEAAQGQPARHAPHRHFAGIQSDIVRCGAFQAYFSNYERSLWARGFVNLWHKDHGDFVFSTLHSVPSQVEKAKLRLGDTGDWSGFPHVRVTGPMTMYDSHQRIEGLEVVEEHGIRVRWREQLLARDGSAGGRMTCSYCFRGERLIMIVQLRELVGEATVDFHLLKRVRGFFQCWDQRALAAMASGGLPERHGILKLTPRTQRFGIQIDGSVFAFETKALRNICDLQILGPQPAGLHSSNLGGVRVRFSVPAEAGRADLHLSFTRIVAPM
jgi:hypothetical protein